MPGPPYSNIVGVPHLDFKSSVFDKYATCNKVLELRGPRVVYASCSFSWGAASAVCLGFYIGQAFIGAVQYTPKAANRTFCQHDREFCSADGRLAVRQEGIEKPTGSLETSDLTSADVAKAEFHVPRPHIYEALRGKNITCRASTYPRSYQDSTCSILALATQVLTWSYTNKTERRPVTGPLLLDSLQGIQFWCQNDISNDYPEIKIICLSFYIDSVFVGAVESATVVLDGAESVRFYDREFCSPTGAVAEKREGVTVYARVTGQHDELVSAVMEVQQQYVYSYLENKQVQCTKVAEYKATHSKRKEDSGFFDINVGSTNPQLHWRAGTADSPAEDGDLCGGSVQVTSGLPLRLFCVYKSGSGTWNECMGFYIGRDFVGAIEWLPSGTTRQREEEFCTTHGRPSNRSDGVRQPRRSRTSHGQTDRASELLLFPPAVRDLHLKNVTCRKSVSPAVYWDYACRVVVTDWEPRHEKEQGHTKKSRDEASTPAWQLILAYAVGSVLLLLLLLALLCCCLYGLPCYTRKKRTANQEVQAVETYVTATTPPPAKAKRKDNSAQTDFPSPEAARSPPRLEGAGSDDAESDDAYDITYYIYRPATQPRATPPPSPRHARRPSRGEGYFYHQPTCLACGHGYDNVYGRGRGRGYAQGRGQGQGQGQGRGRRPGQGRSHGYGGGDAISPDPADLAAHIMAHIHTHVHSDRDNQRASRRRSKRV